MARQKVLEVLVDGIEDQSRLSASQRVVAIESTDTRAVIVGEDGRKVSCDIIAGADGVRSLVRREIESRSLHTKTQLSGTRDAPQRGSIATGLTKACSI